MNHNQYNNQELSYSEDDDGDMEFQDQTDDVEMSYNTYATYTSNVTRKKPGRKPGPACPTLRKEQNRAAQRAFRDRKERHLQQLENMIKDLKSQHFIVVSAYQREIRQLKALIETLQSENYYLREVVFAFEVSLSKGNHKTILDEVKQELFRRHYESKTSANSRKQSSSSPAPETPTSSATSGTPATPSKNSIPPATPPIHPVSVASPNSPSLVSTTSYPSESITSSSNNTSSQAASSSGRSAAVPSTSAATGEHEDPKLNNPVILPNRQKHDMSNSEEGFYSLNGDILFKAPPLFIPEFTVNGELVPPTTPYSAISVPRPAYRPPGTNLPKYTDYQKHENVFDELQSSLFPPGTLESLHINMATPQEVVSDDSLFAEPMDAEEKNSNSKVDVDTSLVKIEDEEYDLLNEDFVNKVAVTLGMKKESVPIHRLHKEFRALAASQPLTDPNIDPKIYELPHDIRIDYIPCPKLRAQMIVHQHRYDVDELFQLLISEAICHGPPLRKDSWELPEPFFEKFGFLLGPELDRIRNKTWPPKPLRD
ncbi:hypothetical protein BGZ76_006008 [Entomortierella beljakovae]|nr:hypothetical protein BGZ76_006008 [Entomortierella beljakovae]